MPGQEIHWSQAQQLEKQQKKKQAAEKREYDENLKLAVAEVWNSLGHDTFMDSDVSSIAYQFGVDEDDLIFSLI